MLFPIITAKRTEIKFKSMINIKKWKILGFHGSEGLDYDVLGSDAI
jgi:hypothetical protein